ncbi:MAG: Na+/H+ antiporter subunit E [Aeromicrobium sp.]
MTANIAARIPVVATLTILWMLLWGGVTPLLVVGGILVGLLVTTVFPFPPAGWKGHFRPWPAVRLVVIFFVDLLVASLQVAWIAVRPAAPPRSAVIRVDMVTRSELLLTLTVELVSLVPGSLLIELDSEHGYAWLHLLDGSTPRKIEQARSRALAQERRVIEALGSQAELAACRGGAS